MSDVSENFHFRVIKNKIVSVRGLTNYFMLIWSNVINVLSETPMKQSNIKF